VPGQPTQDYTYDPYGNTLSIGPSPTNPCPSSTSTCLGYDAQARLSSVTEPNNGPTVAMTYNAEGLRASYTVTPYGASQPSLSEQFTYRGGQLAQTVVVSGAATYTDTYVYSQHGLPLELLRATNGVLARYWYLRDGLGNVTALTKFVTKHYRLRRQYQSPTPTQPAPGSKLERRFPDARWRSA